MSEEVKALLEVLEEEVKALLEVLEEEVLLLEELLDDVLEEEMKEEVLNKRKRKGLRRRSPASLSIQDTSESGEENTLRIMPSADTPRNIVKSGDAVG